ncbi:ceramide glucosyltransferase [Rhodoferax sp. U2-2l]|uniref:ceramide glucosyltransferase n=1 Tax=Rhodoferax sp. U2-2l TaxID=2884000 RepID=UPI001D0B2D5A|nr:ceramide glucosyltransferase [Rhodoferax sp. U2-2l]MCB8748887.1 ceramide glucosyltransferase [Rhodoferax sp. U2-2l]
MTLTVLLAGFFCAVVGLHAVSCALVVWRLRGSDPSQVAANHPPLSVIRPVCGLDPYLDETLASSFSDLAGACEVIFCVAQPDDPAIPVIRRLIAAHPEAAAQLLIGIDVISGNPKLNNVAKGWAAARHDAIVIIDSNVLLPRDYVQTLFASWRPDTGLVTSPPVGIRAEGLWAKVESAFLNTYQDRWQMASDQLGNGFAQGKVLFWRRHVLEAAGGLAALGRDLAEDVASTKVVRAAGLKVRVVRRPFPQPLGRRSFGEVWSRQLRWARVRRDGFPALFALEPLTGLVPPLATLIALALAGVVSTLVVPLFLGFWYGAEWLVARQADWPATLADVGAWLVRDVLLLAIWLGAFAAKGFVWRGNAMQPPPMPTTH